MKHTEIIQVLGQVETQQVADTFEDFIRGSIRNTFIELMATEVEALCGTAYDRTSNRDYRRSGNAPSALEIEGESIKRPRVGAPV